MKRTKYVQSAYARVNQTGLYRVIGEKEKEKKKKVDNHEI